ncbi:MAG: RnfABCDGE type electron transport complex subunit B [Proteobacteria bacterium]|nr:RnfABCDGE type electron transport complex subunit B [Pseudomonadota bacterium]
MTALGITLAIILAVANRYMYVWEDPRIGEVDEMLPQSNCGACGTPGCRQFAEKLVKGLVEVSQCTVNSRDGNAEIAHYLGVDAGTQEKRVARLACAGGHNVARNTAGYSGMQTCRGATLISGGGKGCHWGCLGLGDCEDVCDFDAISMDKYGLPVVDENKCTACEDCVDVCPKALFEIHPVSHQLWVACKNLHFGDVAEVECEVACNACERCVKDSEPGLIEIRENLAVIHYNFNDQADRSAIERCPTGAIVWITPDARVHKGYKAKKIIRKSALPIH